MQSVFTYLTGLSVQLVLPLALHLEPEIVGQGPEQKGGQPKQAGETVSQCTHHLPLSCAWCILHCLLCSLKILLRVSLKSSLTLSSKSWAVVTLHCALVLRQQKTRD